MHRVRRLALFTAVNIDGTRTYDLERSSDRWVLDPASIRRSRPTTTSTSA